MFRTTPRATALVVPDRHAVEGECGVGEAEPEGKCRAASGAGQVPPAVPSVVGERPASRSNAGRSASSWGTVNGSRPAGSAVPVSTSVSAGPASARIRPARLLTSSTHRCTPPRCRIDHHHRARVGPCHDESARRLARQAKRRPIAAGPNVCSSVPNRGGRVIAERCLPGIEPLDHRRPSAAGKTRSAAIPDRP